MNWLLGRSSSAPGNGRAVLTPAEKLRGYYDLAKEAGTRAIEADEQRRVADALRLYLKALEIIREGLALQVPSSGLSAKADNVASWRQQLGSWQGGIQDRVRQLELTGAGSAAPDARSILSGARLLPDAPQPQQQPAPAALPRPRQQQPQRSQGGRAAAAVAAAAAPAAAAAGAVAARAAVSKEEERLRQLIAGEILERAPSVSFDDIAGLQTAKQALREAVVLPTLRADIFSGLRAPARGILLYGPPGNGKTMLARALAAEARATFFSISAASLTSKWVGEGEKLVRTLFAMAAQLQPSVIFMDEVDSLLSSRSSQGEHDAARRLKTEFLVQFDGVAAAGGGGAGDARVVVVGATNRPQELDDAVRRRLVKRIYIPLPDAEGREAILRHLLDGPAAGPAPRRSGGGGGKGAGGGVRHSLSRADVQRVVAGTEGYSASDLTALCREAALGPVRELGPEIASVSVDRIRPVGLEDFAAALRAIRPSLSRDQLRSYDEFTREYGTT